MSTKTKKILKWLAIAGTVVAGAAYVANRAGAFDSLKNGLNGETEPQPGDWIFLGGSWIQHVDPLNDDSWSIKDLQNIDG